MPQNKKAAKTDQYQGGTRSTIACVTFVQEESLWFGIYEGKRSAVVGDKWILICARSM
jgi:hypothetical protein